MVDADEATYKEIVSKLEDAALADKLSNSEEWKLVTRAAKEIRDVTQDQYNRLDHSDPNSKLKAIQCQVTIQFYDNFLQSLINRYQVIGREAYGYAQDMGWLQSLAIWIKSKI
jgi:hypothetical protein